jgi:hypothetical protein
MIKYKSSPQKIPIEFDPSYENFECKKNSNLFIFMLCNYVKLQKFYAT